MYASTSCAYCARSASYCCSFCSNLTFSTIIAFVGDLTYPYQILNGKTQTIKDIIENKNEITNDIINSKKPLVVLGESFLELKSANYLFYSLKEFLSKNNKFTQDWSPLNILSTDASTVGSIDLDLVDQNNSILDDLKQNKFEIIYLLNQDNLDFVKKDEFIIYQGSHGDKGAEIADIILPSLLTALPFTNDKGLSDITGSTVDFLIVVELKASYSG